MRPHGRNIVVGCLYRPRDASQNYFNKSIKDILAAIRFGNKLSCILCLGDFNVNILNSHSHQSTNEIALSHMVGSRNVDFGLCTTELNWILTKIKIVP